MVVGRSFDCPNNESRVDAAGKTVARGVAGAEDVEVLRGETSGTVE